MENEAPLTNTTEIPPLPPLPEHTPPPKKRPNKWLWIVPAILLLVLAAGGAYWWLNKRDKTQKPTTQSEASTQESSQTPSPSQSTSTGTKHYISNGKDLNLEFDYPDNWTVSPPSGNNSSDQTITVTSPQTTLSGANGTSVIGKMIVTIRSATTGAKEFNNGEAVFAAIDSVQIAYKAPSSVQRQYPYLTFIHFADSGKEPGIFEEAMITGAKSYKKGETVTGPTASPIISASLYQCSSDTCSDADKKFLSINYDIWQNNTYSRQAQSLFTSLKIN